MEGCKARGVHSLLCGSEGTRRVPAAGLRLGV